MNDTIYIPISDLRRRFGEIEENLPKVNKYIVTKKGKPFAELKATPEAKRELMHQAIGAFKGTELEKDEFWEEILKKKSRKDPIVL